MEIKPDEVIFIGNSLSYYQVNTGVDFVLQNSVFNEEIDNPAYILELLNRGLKGEKYGLN